MGRMMQAWLLLQDFSGQLGRALARAPHPEVLGQRQERVFRRSSLLGMSQEPVPLSIFMETGKKELKICSLNLHLAPGLAGLPKFCKTRVKLANWKSNDFKQA